MATVVAKIIAEILGMDHIDTQVVGDRVIYKYKSTGILSSAGVQELKAKIFSLLDFPADIPIDVRITPVKRGAIFKEYVVEIEVPRERFKAEHFKYLRMKYRLIDKL